MNFTEFKNEIDKVVCSYNSDTKEYTIKIIDFGVNVTGASNFLDLIDSKNKEVNQAREKVLAETENLDPAEEGYDEIVKMRNEVMSKPNLEESSDRSGIGSTVSPLLLTYNNTLTESVSLDEDFESLYQLVLTNIYNITEKSETNEVFSKKIEEADANEFLKKLNYRLNNTSNFIAANGRIGNASFVISNSSNKEKIENAQALNKSNRKITNIYDDRLLDNVIVTGRKAEESQPCVAFVYTVEDNKLFYEIINIGDKPENQYMSFEF